MSYIRTKNKIVKVETIADIQTKVIFKDNFVAQSENLEALCDMTIVVDDERPDNVFELEWYIDEDLINKYKDVKGVYVYGAIWTKWGLKYVAKMNSKGELELI